VPRSQLHVVQTASAAAWLSKQLWLPVICLLRNTIPTVPALHHHYTVYKLPALFYMPAASCLYTPAASCGRSRKQASQRASEHGTGSGASSNIMLWCCQARQAA
jgi:hypothetical protein